MSKTFQVLDQAGDVIKEFQGDVMGLEDGLIVIKTGTEVVACITLDDVLAVAEDQ